MEYEPILLNQRKTAYVMGVSERNFMNWDVTPFGTKDGTVYYDLKKVIAWKLEKEKSKGSNLTAKRERILELMAEKKEMELMHLKGELIQIELIEEIWSSMLSSFKSQLLSFPSRLSKLISVIDSPLEIEDIIKTEVRTAFEEFKKFKYPKKPERPEKPEKPEKKNIVKSDPTKKPKSKKTSRTGGSKPRTAKKANSKTS